VIGQDILVRLWIS